LFHILVAALITVAMMCFIEWHEKGFITFVLSAEVYMITTIVLCRWRQKRPDFSTVVNATSFFFILHRLLIVN